MLTVLYYINCSAIDLNHDKRDSNSCATNGRAESIEGKERVTKGKIHAPGNTEDNINQMMVVTPKSTPSSNGITAT